MIGIIGINYKTAPVEIREKFSFTQEEKIEIKNILTEKIPGIGIVILSTCNRTEVYCAGDMSHKQAFSLLLQELSKYKNYNSDYYQYFYFKKGMDAVTHLFNVASGIDSLIIGEDQIMGQVKEAYNFAKEIKGINKIITRLFLKAIETGKKVRSATKINQGSASSSSAAVLLARQHCKSLQKSTVLMVGAGKTGGLVLSNLEKNLPAHIYIANRTFSKAQMLAFRFKAEAISLDEIVNILPEVDIVFIATDAQNPLIKKEEMEFAANQSDKNQLYIDLSVPRNIEKLDSENEQIKIFTIDDLKEIVERTNQLRKDEVYKANQIIDDMLNEFGEWMQTQDIVPTIKSIKQNLKKINEQELEGFIKIKSIKEPELVEEYANHITEKFARLLIKNLRELSKEQKSSELAELVEQLTNFN